jgi:hypothetical protein
MLIPDSSRFHFFHDDLDSLRLENRGMADLLTAGSSPSAANDRYVVLADKSQESLACFFNLTTAMSQINLTHGTVLDYLRQVIWDDPKFAFAQDRFFGFAEAKLIDEVTIAAGQRHFAQEPHPETFHPGSTLSYKQTQFGEANVQLAFHQNDPAPQPGWLEIEPDIDYYKDLAAHGLREVLRNKITNGLTNPKEVYVLRWIAGRQAGTPDFNPPFEIV